MVAGDQGMVADHVGTKMLFAHHQLFSDSDGRPSASNKRTEVMPFINVPSLAKKAQKTRKSESVKILDYCGQ